MSMNGSQGSEERLSRGSLNITTESSKGSRPNNESPTPVVDDADLLLDELQAQNNDTVRTMSRLAVAASLSGWKQDNHLLKDHYGR